MSSAEVAGERGIAPENREARGRHAALDDEAREPDSAPRRPDAAVASGDVVDTAADSDPVVGSGAGAPAARAVEASGGQDDLDVEDEVLTGRRLGRYRVGPVVHSGPMSTLYRADDVRLDRPVALKVISPLLAAEEEFRARFVDEARSLSAVDHPHVVPLYDHDEDPDGHLWLAMRWVDGVTLAQAVAGRPMPLARCLVLFDQVASALDAVHACGLVHLDVKPANILLTVESARADQPGQAGRAEHVYLADFGLTRRGRSGGRTAAGEFVGSPAFASPEHLRGEPVSTATDLYGLACSLTVALTGRPPYLGSINEVISAHLAGQLRPASRVRGEVVPPLEVGLEVGLALGPATDAELARALSPDPAARHASAGELMAAVGAGMQQDARGPRPVPRPAMGSAPGPPMVNGPAPSPPGPDARPGSVHGHAPMRRIRPAVAPLTEELFTTSRARPPAAARDPHAVFVVVGAIAVVVTVLVLALAMVLA